MGNIWYKHKNITNNANLKCANSVQFVYLSSFLIFCYSNFEKFTPCLYRYTIYLAVYSHLLLKFSFAKERYWAKKNIESGRYSTFNVRILYQVISVDVRRISRYFMPIHMNSLFAIISLRYHGYVSKNGPFILKWNRCINLFRWSLQLI